MGDGLFGVLCRYIGMPLFAMGDGFLEMLRPFIQMRVLHIFLSHPGMLERFGIMRRQGIGMPLFAMVHGFLGMLQGFTHMLVPGKSQASEQRERRERGNRRYNHCSAMDSHCHGILLNGQGLGVDKFHATQQHVD